MPVRHLPASGGALADDLADGAPVQPGLLGEVQRLGKSLHKAGDRDLVAHLRQLPGADLADAAAQLGVGRHHRLRPVVGVPGAAAHDRQLAVLGPGLAAGDRRVDEVESRIRRLRLKLPGHPGRDGGVVDEERARLHSREGAVVAKADAAQIVVVSDAGHDESRPRSRLPRRRRALAAMLLDPFLRLGGGAVVDPHLVARRLEMARHGVAHDPEPEKCQLRHGFVSRPIARRDRCHYWRLYSNGIEKSWSAFSSGCSALPSR